ncbi:TNF receptor-associated factor 1-like [Eublepharis macularius]|uniref:TNF receptor-associated factor 1-like n=1 Tax=Eublepharis macularius TaxID=481883 RepID=A0AA97JB12_EUBMA|nr:TNF receptor-associated factor 1-like [Eublepharis macularius]
MSCSDVSNPEYLKENRMQSLNHFDQVSLPYQSTPGGTPEENMASQQHPRLLEALQQLADLDFPLDKLWERLMAGLPLKQKVEELETQQKTLENIVSVLSRELGRRDAAPADTLGEAMARILYLEEKVEHQDSLLAMKDVMISNLVARIHTLEQTTYDGCFLWKISDVGLRTQEALTNKRPALYSPCFYTSRYGYKLRLKLFLNGDGIGTRTHLSLFLVVMKGEYDFQLKWPFQHKVTFTLLDQVNKHHVSTSFRPLQTSSSFQRPMSENNVASGLPEFFPLNLLHASGATYICNNTLAFQAVIDTKA